MPVFAHPACEVLVHKLATNLQFATIVNCYGKRLPLIVPYMGPDMLRDIQGTMCNFKVKDACPKINDKPERRGGAIYFHPSAVLPNFKCSKVVSPSKGI